MKSENYRKLLENEYILRELEPEDFNNTLNHFAKLYIQEQSFSIIKKFSNYINDFVPSPNITDLEINDYLKK